MNSKKFICGQCWHLRSKLKCNTCRLSEQLEVLKKTDFKFPKLSNNFGKVYTFEYEKEYLWWVKESDNKLSYELDRYFIEAMAKRMQQNKGKYPPYNRQKPMDIENLKQALLRHTIEIMKGNYTDIEDYDHLSAIACNAQFIYYQLKNHVQNW